MDSFENITNSIKSIFKVSEENISSLSKMLANIDLNHIYNRFGQSFQENVYSDTDLLSKSNLLNALLEIVLENPNMEKVDNEDRKRMVVELFGASASIYEQLLTQMSDYHIWNNLKYLVMYSMLSYLADKQTISNIYINEYNEKLNLNIEIYNQADIMQKLEYDTYYIIVLMLSNVKNQEGLQILDGYLEKANEALFLAQSEEVKKEEMDISNGLKIASFGNIVYLTSVLKEYLFTGKIEDEQSQDIFTIIDMYSYNAFHLLSTENIELKIVGHLLKYSYERIAENSIWSIAEKSPLIRQFIENNLSVGNRYIYSLLPSQREAISEVLSPKKSIIVGMPTSAGKSLLAEMQILFSIHNYKVGDFKPTVCYIVPTNALIDQVRHDLQDDFKEFDFNIETALPYYDVDEIENELLLRKHIDILISTPEKLEALIRQNHPSIRNTRLVIMDEAHNLGDKSRGSKFELVLATVKQKIKEANFLLLSPFITNAGQIGEWLADSSRNATTISVEWTPTRQYVGCNLLNTKKTASTLKFYKSARNQLGSENIEISLQSNPHNVQQEMGEDRLNNAVKLCVILNDFIHQEGNILVLCAGPGTTKTLAQKVMKYFVEKMSLTDISNDNDVKRAIEIIKLENGEEDSMLECVKYGICYHNSGLSNLVKETLEELIRMNKIKLVFATTTLAQGMNFPINTVIFDTVNFVGTHARAFTNAEFWNIAGRAGRAYKDKEGYVIISFSNDKRSTEEKVKQYIKADLNEVVSSLNMFFEKDNTISLDYNFLKETDNAPVLNLLQYINHILNISYDYNINPLDIAKIRTILNDSFLYHSLSKGEGFINAQRKLNTFVTQYVRHVNLNKKEDMAKADELGISDISYTKVKAMIGAFIIKLKEAGDNEYKVSEILLNTKNLNRLTEIINIIAKIPEINIEMMGQGTLDPQSIARLLLGWVNGEKVKDIAQEISRDGQSINDVISLCNRYLNNQMKSYMPWGINIYQNISFDVQTENAQMIPSYIYYGVADKESVIVSKIGVPRFAVNNVLKVLKTKYSELEINAENMDRLKEVVRTIDSEDYHVEKISGDVIKNIINRKL